MGEKNIPRSVRILAWIVLVTACAAVLGWTTVAGARMGDVMGIIARKGDAAIEVSDQVGATSTLKIDRVAAPRDSWVVVHLDGGGGMPGERIGVERIGAGVSRDVEVDLGDAKLTPDLLVAVHIDRGKPDEFEFDMDKKESSPDKPYFVDGKEVATKVAVAEFGVKAQEGEAAVEVADQPGASDTIVVKRAVAPAAAWVVVHLDDNGMPGERVGLQQIAAGENADVNVALDPKVELTDKLLVAVHADRGTAGTFEFDMEDKLGSPDQPFFVDGMEVATAVRVK